nr:MAG TPA: hypothetical protein [Caudoviricetes sp.]
MTRENVKKNMEIISAFAVGKTIQILNERGEWEDLTEREGLPMGTLEDAPDIFRIKPEPKYRPFANAEECWQEMLKHQPFGVVKDKYFANYQTHRAFTCLITNGCDFGGYEDETFESCFKNLLFADGFPFGVKIDE